MSTPQVQKSLREEILLARYKENCDQARHHENLRERTTATVAATVGVVLGLISLKAGCGQFRPLSSVVFSFIMLLGLFGVFASSVFDNRARMHRAAIRKILEQLGATSIRDGWLLLMKGG